MKEYPRLINPDIEPFDPIELAQETERIVCDGANRKYTDFYATGVYGGIATGYTVGCCLRCIFCWVDFSRDYPEKYGKFRSPEEAFERLKDTAHRYGTTKLRISGAEPTLGKEHLLGLLRYVENSQFDLFILETNGIKFGLDKDYVKEVTKFNKVHIRLSLKAGTPTAFTKKTGAKPASFDIPFDAIRNLIAYGARFHVAAMSADRRMMDRNERESLIKRLDSISRALSRNLEEEIVDPYRTTLIRLKHAGVNLSW